MNRKEPPRHHLHFQGAIPPPLPPARFNPFNFGIAVFMGVFCSIFFIAPFLVPEDTVHFGGEGTILPHEFGEQIEEMHPLARWAYKLGDATCHQIEDRSLTLNGNQMPLCARCTAIYVGMFAGCLLSSFLIVDLKLWWVLGGFIPLAVDGVGQTILGLWESTNLVRILTGFPAGLVTMMALGWVMWDIYDDLRYRRFLKKEGQKRVEPGPEARKSAGPTDDGAGEGAEDAVKGGTAREGQTEDEVDGGTVREGESEPGGEGREDTREN